MRVNINADIGEGFGKYSIGDDIDLMPLIASANVACGMHAGDPTIMVRTIQLAIEYDVSVGAHPGFNDIWGFGRRRIKMASDDLENLVAYQIGALQALARHQGTAVTHVKPHGALNNMAHEDIEYALAIGRGIKAADPGLVYVANAGSKMSEAAKQLGLRVANEAYVDRVYNDDGTMVSRENPDAVIKDPERAAAQVLRILQEGELLTPSGRRIGGPIHTFCVHGDEPTAVPVMRAVRKRLAEAGIEVVPLPALLD